MSVYSQAIQGPTLHHTTDGVVYAVVGLGRRLSDSYVFRNEQDAKDTMERMNAFYERTNMPERYGLGVVKLYLTTSLEIEENRG